MKVLKALLPAFMLTACATVPVPGTVTSQGGPLPDTTAIDHWHLSGRISLTQGDTGWHAGMDWAERTDSFSLRVSGPLGQGGFLLTGNADGVLLRDAESRLYTATDTDTLLAQVTGWVLPVAGMRYWVRGLSAPDGGYQAEYDGQGRLVRLDQQGWAIHYTRYHNTATGLWPARLHLTRDDIVVRLVIDQWRLGQPLVPLP